jgi:hypothetical protein
VIHENLEAGKAIRYQPEVINPHKLYIQISFTDYEYLLDVKKHSKISISFILTKAIATYLTRKYRSTDQFHQEIVGVYSIGMVKTDKDRIDWHVYWITMPDPEGIEEEIEEEAPT